MRESCVLLVGVVALVLGWMWPAVPAHAQPYPASPITLVIPLAPGDATDVAGRTIADALSRLLKVAIVPVNRPGAGGAIGADSVAKARKDGYTILIATNAALITTRILNPEIQLDPVRDLVPLGMVARTPIIVALRSDTPYRAFAELVEFSQKHPGKVRIGTAGAGSVGHFGLELVNSLTGAGLTMVPFKGASPAITAILGGHVEGVVLAVGVLAPHLKSGALRGVVTSSRAPDFPEIPTLSQLGQRQNLVGLWQGFFAPAGVPAEVTAALGPAIERVVKDPATATKLTPHGIVLEYLPPDRLLAEMKEEARTLQEIARKAGLAK
jgi:tripartite-type tricarboxylate transporter receptor subunit TctC